MPDPVTLVFTVCISMLGSYNCHDERRPMPNALSCMVLAQPLIAAWTGDSPGYQLQGWRCEEPHA